jgi:hypothetical protein
MNSSFSLASHSISSEYDVDLAAHADQANAWVGAPKGLDRTDIARFFFGP